MMTSDAFESPKFPHLANNVWPLALQDADQRILIAKSPCWIPNIHTRRLLSKLEYIYTYPRTTDLPNLLIVAPSGNGKTSLIEEFLRLHPQTDDVEAESASVPVVSCEFPPTADVGSLYNELLRPIGLPPHRGRIDARREHAMDVIQIVQTKLIIFDEVQHGLQAGPHTQRQLLNSLKSLNNILRIPIICLGTREALSFFNKDEQIRRRFAYDEIPRWGPNMDWRRLLVSFEQLIPLRLPSNLKEPSTARLLHAMADGTIGKLAKILAAAAEEAIRGGEERITKQILDGLDLDNPNLRQKP